MARYTVSCTDCAEEIGETNDPRQAYDIARGASDHNAQVIARGLVNSVRFNQANRDREN